MASHKKQHYVPQTYMRGWCDPVTPAGHKPSVWRFDCDGRNPRRKAPVNICHVTDLYTRVQADGSRDVGLERALGVLESKFASLRRLVLPWEKRMDEEQTEFLLAFVAALHHRTPWQRDHLAQSFGQMRDMAKAMQAWADQATPEQLAAGSMPPSEGGEVVSVEFIERMAEEPLQTGLAPTILREAERLLKLDLAVLGTRSESGFITSDNPCVWFDADAATRPSGFNFPTLDFPGIEITVPVSPRQIIFLNRVGLRGYKLAPDWLVDELNRRTRGECREHFISNSCQLRSAWFR